LSGKELTRNARLLPQEKLQSLAGVLQAGAGFVF
jgi:hypothetical protein